MSQKMGVVVTGGTRGIGLAIAQAYAAAGHHVVVGSRTNHLSDSDKKKIHFVPADVRKKNDHLALVKAVKELAGQLDCYINCAGISVWKSIDEVDSEFWNSMVQTNLEGTFWGCQAAASQLSKNGTIINISSLAGKRGSSNNSVYCATKFGINGLTQALAKELGPQGIRVNAVCPVYVETEMILESLKDPKSPSGGKNVQAYLNEFTKGNAALQRLPKASEIAQTCLFLSSSQASAITGQCINVDCGVMPQ